MPETMRIEPKKALQQTKNAVTDPEEFENMSEDSTVLQEKAIYKRIYISNLDQLYNFARKLNPEQRFKFDNIIGYC